MGNLKIGKKTKFGGPSDAFLQSRGMSAGRLRERPTYAKNWSGPEYKSDTPTSVEKETVDDGSVKIYMDDERPCPEGWLLARSAREFLDLMNRDEEFLSKVTAISLDWYLGSNSPDGMFVAKHLAEKFLEPYMFEREPQNFLPNLKAINFHSSDKDQARKMRTEIVEAFKFTDEARLSSVRLRLG